jgi:predicted dehydrogenase
MKYLNGEDKIGLALISFAHFHQFKWVEAFKKDERCSIVGFWDDDVERGRIVERETGIPFFKNLDKLLSNEQVTAGAICSETSKHYYLIQQCIRYNLPMMCEKPTARNVNECLQIKDLIDTSSLPFLQVFPQRLMTGNIRIKQLIDSGELGQITHVRKRHGHGFGLKSLDSDMPWIVSQTESGGGAYLDEGIHETDLLRYYFGMPLSVCAELSNRKCGQGEMSATALYKFKDDLTVVHEAGWNWLAGGPTTEIYGEEGVIIESLTDCASSTGNTLLPHLSLFRKETGLWETLEDKYDFPSIHYLFPVSFLDMLSMGIPPIATIEDGLKALEMVEGVYKSAIERRTYEFNHKRDLNEV